MSEELGRLTVRKPTEQEIALHQMLMRSQGVERAHYIYRKRMPTRYIFATVDSAPLDIDEDDMRYIIKEQHP